MTFKKAYQIAMNHPGFRNHVNTVTAATIQAAINPEATNTTPCLVFIVDDEYFYYGFDGCEIQKGKYSPKAAARFRDNGFGLPIR